MGSRTMTRWCVASVFLAVALLCATCSEATPVTDAPPAPSTWRFLDSGRTDYFGDDTTDIELRGSFVEIDNVAIPDTVDFETEVVLIIGTNAGADKPGPCGPPQYTDLAFAPGSITISLPPFDSANDVSCPAVDSPGVTLIAISRSEIPEVPISVVIGNAAPKVIEAIS